MTDNKTKKTGARKPAHRKVPGGADAAKKKATRKTDKPRGTGATPAKAAISKGVAPKPKPKPAKSKKRPAQDTRQAEKKHPPRDSAEYDRSVEVARPTHHRLRRVVSIALPLVLLVLAILYVGRAPIAAAILMSRLSAAGVAEPEFIVEEFGFTSMQIASVVLGSGGEFEAERIKLSYRWSDLLLGTVRRLDVERPRLRLEITTGGISAGSLDGIFGKDRVSHDGLPTIRLRRGVIDAVTPVGTIAARFDGTLQPNNGAAVAALTVTIEGGLGRIDGTFKGTFAEPGTGAGEFTVTNAQLRLPAATLDGISGGASFELTDGQLQTGALDLSAPDSALWQTGLKTVSLSARKDGGPATAELRLLDAGRWLDATFRAEIAPRAATSRLTLTGDARITGDSPLWQLLGLQAPDAGEARLGVVAFWPIETEAPQRDEAGTPDASFTLELNDIAYGDLVTGLDATLGIDLSLRADAIELTLPTQGLVDVKRVAPELYRRAAVPPPPIGPIKEPLSLVIERSTTGPARIVVRSDRDGMTAALSGALSIMTKARNSGRPPVAGVPDQDVTR